MPLTVYTEKNVGLLKDGFINYSKVENSIGCARRNSIKYFLKKFTCSENVLKDLKNNNPCI